MPDSASIILAGGRSRRMGTDKAMLEIDGETLLARIARAVSAVVTEVLIVGRNELPPGMENVRALEDAYPDTGPLGGIATGLERIEAERVLVVACDLPFLQEDVLRLLLELAPGYEAVVPRAGGEAHGDGGQARRPAPTDGAGQVDVAGRQVRDRPGGQARGPAPTESLSVPGSPSPALRGRGQGWGCADGQDIPRRAGSASACAQPQPTCAVYARSCLPVMQRYLETGRYRLNELLNELHVRWVDEEELRRVDPPLRSFLNPNTHGEWDKMLREYSSVPEHLW